MTGYIRALPVQNAMRGIALMCAAFLAFSLLDASAKMLGRSYPITQVVWARYAGHAIVAVLFLWPDLRDRPWRSARPGLQVLRGLILVCGTSFNFIALQYLQLAQTSAIYFSTPLLVAALSVPILGERVGPRRWAAIIVGFIGVMIVIRPGLDGIHWAMGLSCLTALSGASYQILTRKLAGADSVHTAQLYSSMVGLLAFTPLAPTQWIAPDAVGWLLMLVVGAMGGIGHWLLTHAHAYAPAPTLAPFSYTQILWMPILGYLLFGDIPSTWTVAGSGIVVCSGLYLLHRERVVKGR